MCIALIMTIVYFFMDRKLDSQTGEAEEKDDPFKVSDIGKILSDSGFWIVASSACFTTRPFSPSRSMP